MAGLGFVGFRIQPGLRRLLTMLRSFATVATAAIIALNLVLVLDTLGVAPI